MKRERYFQDELWRMFVTYAILPAALFTFICGVYCKVRNVCLVLLSCP